MIGMLTINSLHVGYFFMIFLSSADIFKINFLIKLFWNIIRVSNSLDLDQDQHSVGPDLGPNCLQRLSVDDRSRH